MVGSLYLLVFVAARRAAEGVGGGWVGSCLCTTGPHQASAPACSIQDPLRHPLSIIKHVILVQPRLVRDEKGTRGGREGRGGGAPHHTTIPYTYYPTYTYDYLIIRTSFTPHACCSS
jgi:hypothetical protein